MPYSQPWRRDGADRFLLSVHLGALPITERRLSSRRTGRRKSHPSESRPLAAKGRARPLPPGSLYTSGGRNEQGPGLRNGFVLPHSPAPSFPCHCLVLSGLPGACSASPPKPLAGECGAEEFQSLGVRGGGRPGSITRSVAVEIPARSRSIAGLPRRPLLPPLPPLTSMPPIAEPSGRAERRRRMRPRAATLRKSGVRWRQPTG
jgi:hypothetical protein